MVAKARGARSQRRDDDGAAGICLPPITAYGLSSEAIEAVERAPPPAPPTIHVYVCDGAPERTFRAEQR